MRIFVSGPYGKREGYSPQQLEANVQHAIEAGVEIIKRGHSPFIPHLYHFLSVQEPAFAEDRFLLMCIDFLIGCDAILMLPDWELSSGALTEHRLAIGLGLKIFWSAEEIPDGNTEVASQK